MSVTRVVLYTQNGEIFDTLEIGQDFYLSTLKKNFTISKIMDDEYGNVAIFFNDVKNCVCFRGFPYKVETVVEEG